jgi:hypothetical protein
MMGERDCNADVCNGSSDQPEIYLFIYFDARKFDSTYQMMTITLNLKNSVKIGTIWTAMEVPMDATMD